MEEPKPVPKVVAPKPAPTQGTKVGKTGNPKRDRMVESISNALMEEEKQGGVEGEVEDSPENIAQKIEICKQSDEVVVLW